MKLSKRAINDDLYKLLENGNIDKIIRHYKLIAKKGYVKNGQNELSQKVNDNTFYTDYIIDSNTHLDNILQFGEGHVSTNEIFELIDTSRSEAYQEYANNIQTSDFTQEEKDEIDRLINAYKSNEANMLYIRLGIDPNDKGEFLKKLYALFIINYFNELTDQKQNELLENSLSPMWNDTIFFSNEKYDYLTQEKNIEQEIND